MSPATTRRSVPLAQHTVPAGSVIEIQVPVGPFSVPHPGIVVYTNDGQAAVIHNSKRHGRPVVENVMGFAEGQEPKLVYLPPSQEKAAMILRTAAAELNREQQWTPLNNCQHFANRAVSGRNESPSLGGIVALTCVAAIGFVLLSGN